MEPPEFKDGRSFVEVINEKYSPENFPYRRGPGMGVVVVPVPQGSPMKGEAWFRRRHVLHTFYIYAHQQCPHLWFLQALHYLMHNRLAVNYG